MVLKDLIEARKNDKVQYALERCYELMFQDEPFGLCEFGTTEIVEGNNFAKLLSEHWDQSKKLDMGCTNTCIDQIFLACDDLIDGKFISGAGGGGFLQVILKKGITKKQLSQRLHEVFQDNGVDVWDSEFI